MAETLSATAGGLSVPMVEGSTESREQLKKKIRRDGANGLLWSRIVIMGKFLETSGSWFMVNELSIPLGTTTKIINKVQKQANLNKGTSHHPRPSTVYLVYHHAIIIYRPPN